MWRLFVRLITKWPNNTKGFQKISGDNPGPPLSTETQGVCVIKSLLKYTTTKSPTLQYFGIRTGRGTIGSRFKLLCYRKEICMSLVE